MSLISLMGVSRVNSNGFSNVLTRSVMIGFCFERIGRAILSGVNLVVIRLGGAICEIVASFFCDPQSEVLVAENSLLPVDWDCKLILVGEDRGRSETPC